MAGINGLLGTYSSTAVSINNWTQVAILPPNVEFTTFNIWVSNASADTITYDLAITGDGVTAPTNGDIRTLGRKLDAGSLPINYTALVGTPGVRIWCRATAVGLNAHVEGISKPVFVPLT
jgi:hypothetical protein